MPAPLENTSARELEFDRLREIVRGYCGSPLGQQRVAALAATMDREWLERQHQLTTELRGFLRAGCRFEFAGLSDPGNLLAKSRIQGATLESEELRSILTLVDRASEWREIVLHPSAQMKEPWPGIEQLSSGIEDFSSLIGYFRNKLLPDGTLDDRASPALASIRREIERQRRTIHDSLRGYLRRLSEGGVVQDELITIRGERFVIPVKSEQKRRVQGVVHGASSSGQTVFIEPLETIEQNNDLVRLLDDEQAEIHRILTEMTSRIGERSAAIAVAVDILGELELQMAKARYAEDYGCTAVKFLAEDAADSIILRNARHPVLERNLRARGAHAVPMTLEMARADRQLIISGPNTGGKTVALKTAGILALMAQSGIPVPAERAEMPIFDSVLADIGDYQSIEQNLSTFSAHVTNIDRLSHTATAQSLVLLDELGSATDPEEGSALAVSIAEHFLRSGALSLISTHHTSLKVYAANTNGVVNAAVGFDEHTLAPTYELRVGVPGASAGINIAQRLGLNAAIIAEARSRLSTQTQDIARFLDKLHADLRELEAERNRLNIREAEVAKQKQLLEQEGLREQRDKVRELEKKLESLLRDLEYHAREAVNAVQDRAEQTKLTKEAERRIAKARREFREQFNQAVVAHTTGSDRDDPNARPHVVQRVSVGDTVQLKSLGRTARVARKLDEEYLEVEAGPMKMRVPIDDVAAVIGRAANNPVAAARQKGINIRLREEDDAPASEINVIGQTVDEATRQLEKFLDRAFLAGLSRVRIVHGSGMGILRKALRQYLREHPQVAAVTEPPQQEGGGGATVVDLKV
ncbi:MAG TPA: endonuclease MutS2 [candidate division Zixibacteria bacterium]|nr:endonuclease MutS2 [candidate division Zixibacteria bacterium]